MSEEHSIAMTKASVMLYDDQMKKWLPAGGAQGFSKVHIYANERANTYRVVGRKISNHEVVINCMLTKGMRYNQASATFHQWRDPKRVYGLNFPNVAEAKAFADSVAEVFARLGGA